MLNQILSVLSHNPIASITIILGLLMFFVAISGTIKLPGSVVYPDPSSRKFAMLVGLAFMVFGLVTVVDPSLSLIFNLFEDTPINKLHRAAKAWDTATAFQAVQELQSSDSKCDQILGQQVQDMLRVRGSYGLNYVNQIQQSIEINSPDCRFPKLNHQDQI